MNIATTFLPFYAAYAGTAGAATESSFITTIVQWAAGIGGGIIALFIIVSLVKDGMEFAKGQGSVSIWKILGKVCFLILVIGLVFLSTGYMSLGNTAKSIGDKGLNTVQEEVNVLLP